MTIQNLALSILNALGQSSAILIELVSKAILGQAAKAGRVRLEVFSAFLEQQYSGYRTQNQKLNLHFNTLLRSV